MDRLGPQVTESQAHTDCVRQQVVAIGDTAGTRHVETVKKHTVLSEQVDRPTGMLWKMQAGSASSAGPMETDSEPMPPPRACTGSTNGAQGEKNGDMPDREVVRANTHTDMGKAQVHAQFIAFLAAHTTVPSAAFKVSGPEAGRSFTLRFGGTAAIAARHADEACQELCDRACSSRLR